MDALLTRYLTYIITYILLMHHLVVFIVMVLVVLPAACIPLNAPADHHLHPLVVVITTYLLMVSLHLHPHYYLMMYSLVLLSGVLLMVYILRYPM